jgi:hypothetical protein
MILSQGEELFTVNGDAYWAQHKTLERKKV